MKVRHFESFEAYENEEVTKGEYEVVDIVKYNNKISADLLTECKTWKTALNRFFKALENVKEFDGWKDGIIESCENGYFIEAETYWNEEKCKSEYRGGWHYQVEELDENLWYIELTVAL
jgi:hypothetical protein